MPKSFNMVVDERDGFLWITFNDSIDMDNHKNIEESIFQKIQQTTARYIVIDLEKTTALFSSGVGVIMRIHGKVQEYNKKLYLVNVQEKVAEGLEIMGLDQTLNIFASAGLLEAAIEASEE
jgi:anti-anti-sigma factor